MSTETLEKPEVASEVVDRAEITGGNVVVEYSRTEAALAALTAKYTGAKYDLTTTAGDKAARAARLELKTLRTGLEDKRKELKAPALTFGQKIDAEAARLKAAIEALEKPIDDQIKADEKRRADEKAERDRIEAERVGKHEANIANIRGYVGLARDLPSARIAKGIASLEAMQFGVEWEEFAERGAEAQRETLEALRSLHDKAKAAEDAAAAAEAQRVEQERVAEAQKAEAKRLQDLADAQAAKEKEAADRIAAAEAELARKQAEFAAQQEAARKAAEAAAAPAEPPTPEPVVEEVEPEAPAVALVMPNVFRTSVALQDPPPAEPAKLVTTGAVCDWLGFGITGAVEFFKSLGFEPEPTTGRGTYWRESDLSPIRDALILRLANLKAPQ